MQFQFATVKIYLRQMNLLLFKWYHDIHLLLLIVNVNPLIYILKHNPEHFSHLLALD